MFEWLGRQRQIMITFRDWCLRYVNSCHIFHPFTHATAPVGRWPNQWNLLTEILLPVTTQTGHLAVLVQHLQWNLVLRFLGPFFLCVQFTNFKYTVEGTRNTWQVFYFKQRANFSRFCFNIWRIDGRAAGNLHWRAQHQSSTNVILW